MDWMRALEEAVYGLEDRYVVAGALPVASPGGVTLAGATFETLTLPSSLDAASPALRSLVRACHTAPFGHGRKTVVDPAVRDALALPAGAFTVRGIDDGAWAQVLERVRVTLVPDAGRVEAELDKLNLYLRGGHFARHRDTPGDPTHFGTLVLCLPLVFAGGDLTVAHNGASTLLPWDEQIYTGSDDPAVTDQDGRAVLMMRRAGLFRKDEPADDRIAAAMAKIAAHTPPAQLRYAAFFGHCEHEISKVSLGVRLTLSYKLRRVGVAPVPLPVPPANSGTAIRAAAFAQTLRAALGDNKFMLSGGRLGFACLHLYEDHELPPGGTPVTFPSAAGSAGGSSSNDTASALLLKGADYGVAAAAASLGLTVKVMRIVSTGPEVGKRKAVARLPASKNPNLYAVPVKLGETLMWSISSAPRWALKRNTLGTKLGGGDAAALAAAYWAVPLPSTSRYAMPTLLGAPLKSLAAVWVSNTGYFGNEASNTTLYTHAALVVTIPPAYTRAAILAAAAPTAIPTLARAVEVGFRDFSDAPQDDPFELHLGHIMHRLHGAPIATLRRVLRAIHKPASGNEETLVDLIIMHGEHITDAVLDALGIPQAEDVPLDDDNDDAADAAGASAGTNEDEAELDENALPPGLSRALAGRVQEVHGKPVDVVLDSWTAAYLASA